MKVTLNETPIECGEQITLEALLSELNRLQPGTALAVNQTIVPRDEWATRALQAEDDILLFQVIAGG